MAGSAGPAPADGDPGAPEGVARRAALERAVGEWTGQLVDLGGRNTLLYFKDLKVGSLDLRDATPGPLEGLLDGRTIALSQLFPETEGRLAQARRCRAIRAKARENLEERGLLTLFLGAGMATWTNQRGTAVPNAPVLLRSLVMDPRGGAEEDFDVVATGDWEVNPTLVHVLRHDFSLDLDVDELTDNAVDDEGRVHAPLVHGRLASAAADVPGFAVTPRSIVANLSYAKMPMVQDLEGSLESLMAHPLVCALAGSESDRAAVRQAQAAAGRDVDEAMPDRMPPADEYLVLDADASQHRVVNLAVAGANLVVQGPPGTGKSQTISNLIATLVARGKSVLFVAEKRAAIDAVTSRVQKVGLGDLVLDLHEGTASRKRLAADLGRALQAMGQVPAADFDAVQRTLVTRRTTLNDHAHALHEHRDPWGVSVFMLQSELLGTAAASRTEQRLFGPALAALGAAAYAEAGDELGEWCNLGGPAVETWARPWSRAAARVRTAEDALRLQQAVAELRSTSVPATRRRLDDVTAAAGLRAPSTLDEATTAVVLLQGVAATLGNLDSAVYEADLPGLVRELEPASRGAFAASLASVVRRRYRAAKRAARALCRSGDDRPRPLRDALARADEQRRDWAELAIGGAGPRGVDGIDAAATALSALRTSLTDLDGALGADPTRERTFEQVAADLAALVDDFTTLQRLPRLGELRARLDARGLGPFVGEVAATGAGADVARSALAWLRGRSVLDHLAATDPRVGAFDGELQRACVGEFIAADHEQIASGVARVRRAAAEGAVRARNAHPEQSDVLERNARLKRRHASIRELMQHAPDVLLAVRPCWIMSPLVVAQLLPGGRTFFDVVVFDEASQIRPADAISALARARQAVVAGDSKQLPPTRFFDVTTTTDDADAGEEPAPWSYTEDMDSILDALSALLPPPHGSQTLSWHYRSRDERLIAFSNAQPDLYDWSLTTFPGAVGDDVLGHVLVPHRPGVGGTVDSSTDEVAAVLDLIRRHATTRPDESLGVIAMGITHADRIREALRLARRDDPVLDRAPCLDDLRAEDPFFVKNLERVQGDERDAIILTIGYPKTPDGRMQYRFGPLNQDGGERRLNVAITRARKRVRVVSSFAPEDMDDDRLRAEGARMLKRYLAYVRSGGTALGEHAMPKPALSGFEQDVKVRLERAGIPLVAQYGVAGSWIDFAARHPTRPGRMVLALEADGAAYHSSPTARARDRLRQEHLERLGWRFHRIWSTDWFRDPERAVEQARAAYGRAVREIDDADEGAARAVDPPPGPADPPPDGAGSPARGPRPSVAPGLPIDDYRPEQLDALCRWITSDTLLRTDEELLDVMMDELGFARRGSRIVAAIAASIERVRPARPR